MPEEKGGLAKRFINAPDWYRPEPDSAAAYLSSRLSDSPDSPYFKKLDFYNARSKGGLTILSGFPVCQQSTGYSCGPCSVLSVLRYFGEDRHSEPELTEIFRCAHHKQDGSGGTATSDIRDFFIEIGWENVSSVEPPKWLTCYPFPSPMDMRRFFLAALGAGLPVMVENLCLGGHWRVVIGYDTMGSPLTANNVVIFMDSDDVRDHCQTGYAVENAEELFHTWFDAGVLPPNQRKQQFIIAAPKIPDSFRNNLTKPAQ